MRPTGHKKIGLLTPLLTHNVCDFVFLSCHHYLPKYTLSVVALSMQKNCGGLQTSANLLIGDLNCKNVQMYIN